MSDWKDPLRRCKQCTKGRHEKCTGYQEWCPCVYCFVSLPPPVTPMPHPRERPTT